MMKPKDMNKVVVFGPKSFMKPIIEAMYAMDVVHIEEHRKQSEEDFFDIGEPHESNEKFAELLVKTRSMISTLDINKSIANPSNRSLDVIEKKTIELFEVSKQLSDKKEYYTHLDAIYNSNKIEKALSLVKIDQESEKKFHYVGFSRLNHKKVAALLEENKIEFQLDHAIYEGITLLAIFSKKVPQKILEKIDFSPIPNTYVKSELNLSTKSGISYKSKDHEANEIKKTIEHLSTQIETLKNDHGQWLLEVEKRLVKETDQAEAPLKFATTKNTFLINGWVPKENAKKLEKKINDISKKKVMIKLEEPKKHENVPIAFNHPKIVEPFEAFMDLYTLPSYKEIDPTFFMFLTFPLFFGFMLGDVGYGLVTLTLFTILKKKMPGAKNFLNAFVLASIASIAFGLVFGEYFGYETVSPALGERLGIEPKLLDSHGEMNVVYPIPHIFARSHGMDTLTSFALMFGVFHILLAYIIGFVNVYRHHGLKHAIMEKGGWILLMPIVVWLLANFLQLITGATADIVNSVLPPLPILGGMAGVGVLLIIVGEGAQGAVELPALLANILSYARLMAVGMASLSLALVVNDLAGQLFSAGIIGIIGGVFVLVIGHTINIALGVLSPFLHSLRLHYVEFFSKFFKGGGKKYESFGFKH